MTRFQSPVAVARRQRSVPNLHVRLVNERTNRWAVVVPLGMDEFGPIRDWHYLYGTEAQANLERDRLRLQLADGTYSRKKPTPRSRRWRTEPRAPIPLPSSPPAVDPASVIARDVITEWLEIITETVSPASARRYRAQAAHLVAHFGEMPIRDIAPGHVVRYRSHCLVDGGRYGRPLSRKTTKEHLLRLRSVLDFADAKGLLDRHPWNAVPHRRNRDPFVPRQSKKRKRVLSDHERIVVLDAVAGHWLEGPVRLALDCGPRIGENLALTWDDIDFAVPQITVVGQIQDGDDDDDPDDPKTEAGVRSIPMSPSTARFLRGTLKRHAALCRLAAHGSCLVFPGTPNGAVHVAAAVGHAFAGLVRRLGFPGQVTLHTLRHTFATRQIMAGVNVQRLSNWLGHADAPFTLRTYAHFFARVAGRAESNRHLPL